MSRWIEKHATAILAVSEGAMRSWRSDWQSDPRCRVIYTGVRSSVYAGAADRSDIRRDIRTELGIPADSALIVHVGTLSAWKNQERLLGIFDCLKQRRPDTYLMLIGRDGGARAKIEMMVKRRRDDSVLLLGERTDVPRLLRASDVMVFPSTREGLPGAVLEACGAGLPVVASTLPGNQEIAARVSGVRCLSLSASDFEWAEAVLKVLASPRTPNGLSNTPFDNAVAARAIRSVYVS